MKSIRDQITAVVAERLEKLRCPECPKGIVKYRKKLCPDCIVKAKIGKTITRMESDLMQKHGELVDQPCETCGAPNAHKHHTDYSDSTIIVWLCAGCHGREHGEIRRGEKPEPGLPPITEKWRRTH